MHTKAMCRQRCAMFAIGRHALYISILIEARGQGALRVTSTPPWPPQPPNGGLKKCCPKSHPTECKTGLQNDSKFDQNHVQRVCREGSAQMYVKRSQFQPSQTLSEGFSCKREHSFHFFARAQKGLQKGTQKLSKWRSRSLTMLSGQCLKKRCIFESFFVTLRT